MKIKNRVIKTANVKWKAFKFIQQKGFKDLSNVAMEKLQESILKNNFVESFKVWLHDGNLICLDGYHRCEVLKKLEKEGHEVPEEFTADFIECKDKKEAAKLVLIFSSRYAVIDNEGLYEFMTKQSLKVADIIDQVEIPDIDLKQFEEGYFKEEVHEGSDLETLYEVVVTCADKGEQMRVFNKLKKKYDCRIV